MSGEGADVVGAAALARIAEIAATLPEGSMVLVSVAGAAIVATLLLKEGEPVTARRDRATTAG